MDLSECNLDCHEHRFTLYSTRRIIGWKRWGVRDQHSKTDLPKLFLTKDSANTHRIFMELREINDRMYAVIRDEERYRAVRAAKK